MFFFCSLTGRDQKTADSFEKAAVRKEKEGPGRGCGGKGTVARVTSFQSTHLLYSPISMLPLLFLLFSPLITCYFSPFNLRKARQEQCHGPIAGDCDPEACGGSCEAKYVRFYDLGRHSDRTIKSCTCRQERICSILGMSDYNGCTTYSSLGATGQKFIRYWSMDRADRRNRAANSVRLRYTDKTRHRQLINGNTRFCCRVSNDNRLALQLKSSSSDCSLLVPFFLYFFH